MRLSPLSLSILIVAMLIITLSSIPLTTRVLATTTPATSPNMLTIQQTCPPNSDYIPQTGACKCHVGYDFNSAQECVLLPIMSPTPPSATFTDRNRSDAQLLSTSTVSTMFTGAVLSAKISQKNPNLLTHRLVKYNYVIQLDTIIFRETLPDVGNASIELKLTVPELYGSKTAMVEIFTETDSGELIAQVARYNIKTLSHCFELNGYDRCIGEDSSSPLGFCDGSFNNCNCIVGFIANNDHTCARVSNVWFNYLDINGSQQAAKQDEINEMWLGDVLEMQVLRNGDVTTTVTFNTYQDNNSPPVETYQHIVVPVPGSGSSIKRNFIFPSSYTRTWTITFTHTSATTNITGAVTTYKFRTWPRCRTPTFSSDSPTTWTDKCGDGTCRMDLGTCICNNPQYITGKEYTCVPLTFPTVVITNKAFNGNPDKVITATNSIITSGSTLNFSFKRDDVNPTPTEITITFENENEYVLLFDPPILLAIEAPGVDLDYIVPNGVKSYTMRIGYELHGKTADFGSSVQIYPLCFGYNDDQDKWESQCDDINATCNEAANECQCNDGYSLDGDVKCVKKTPTITTTFEKLNDAGEEVWVSASINNGNHVYVGTEIKVLAEPTADNLPSTIVAKLIQQNDDNDVIATKTIQITNSNQELILNIPTTSVSGGIEYILVVNAKIDGENGVERETQYTFVSWSQCMRPPSDDEIEEQEGDVLVWVDQCGDNGTCDQIVNKCTCNNNYFINTDTHPYGPCKLLTLPTVQVSIELDNSISYPVHKDGTDNFARVNDLIVFKFSQDTVNPVDTIITVSIGLNIDEQVEKFQLNLDKNDVNISSDEFGLPTHGVKEYVIAIKYTLWDTSVIHYYPITIYPKCWSLITTDPANIHWDSVCQSNATCNVDTNTCECHSGYALLETSSSSSSNVCAEIKYPQIDVSYNDVDQVAHKLLLNSDNDDDGNDNTDVSLHVGTQFTIKFTPPSSQDNAPLTYSANIRLHRPTEGDNTDAASGDSEISVAINNEAVMATITIPQINSKSTAVWKMTIKITIANSAFTGAYSTMYNSSLMTAYPICIDNDDWVTDLCQNDGVCSNELNKCDCSGGWGGQLCQYFTLPSVTINVPTLNTNIKFKHEFNYNNDENSSLPPLPPTTAQTIVNTQTSISITVTPATSVQQPTPSVVIVKLYYIPDVDNNNNDDNQQGSSSSFDIIRITQHTTPVIKTTPLTFTMEIPKILHSDKVFFRVFIKPSEANSDIDELINDSLFFTVLPQCYKQPTNVVDMTAITEWKSTCSSNDFVCGIDGKCKCRDGFTGEDCKIPIDNDDDDKEKEKQHCADCLQENVSSCDVTQDFTMTTTPCKCNNGWGGMLCSDKDECITKSLDQCGYKEMRGVYETTSNNVDCDTKCTCFNQWSGEKCDKCLITTCNNNGHVWKWCDKCGCNAGYTGNTCQCQLASLSLLINGSNKIFQTIQDNHTINNDNDITNSLSLSPESIALQFVGNHIRTYFMEKFNVSADSLNITIIPSKNNDNTATAATTTTLKIELSYNCLDDSNNNTTEWTLETLQTLLDNINESFYTHLGDVFDPNNTINTPDSNTTPTIVNTAIVEPGQSTLPPESERLKEQKDDPNNAINLINKNIFISIVIFCIGFVFNVM